MLQEVARSRTLGFWLESGPNGANGWQPESHLCDLSHASWF